MTDAERCLLEIREFDKAVFAMMQSKGYASVDDLTDTDIAEINKYVGITDGIKQEAML
jgi:hypothetical protein